jgi:hypothetical protein
MYVFNCYYHVYISIDSLFQESLKPFIFNLNLRPIISLNINLKIVEISFDKIEIRVIKRKIFDTDTKFTVYIENSIIFIDNVIIYNNNTFRVKI